MSSRNVYIDAMVVRPEPTGVGRVVLDLLSAMSSEPRGMRFTVVTSHPEMFGFLDGRGEWSVHRVSPRDGIARNTVFLQAGLPGILRRGGAGLVHGMNMIAPLAAPCPVVLTVHDIAFRLFPGTVERPRRCYYRLMLPASLRKAAAVTAVSAATADDLAACYSFAARRVVVVPNGIPSWVEGRSPSGARPRRAPFLFVGTLEPRKNLERILDAYEIFLAEASELDGTESLPDLVLAGGRGWRDSSLRSRIRSLMAGGKLRLAGYCDPDRLWELYRSAQALLFPSLHEGFGLPILEAMAAGLPVLTADRGAMAEVAGDAALTVDPEDTRAIAAGMIRLYREPGLREELADRGMRRRELWTWQQAARRMVEVYDRILG